MNSIRELERDPIQGLSAPIEVLNAIFKYRRRGREQLMLRQMEDKGPKADSARRC
jgi:hypothetical protein